MKDFERRHPDYLRFEWRWKFAYDFWRGGVNILNPDHDVQRIRWYSPKVDTVSDDGSGLSAESSMKISQFSESTGWARSYLWKHERETHNEFHERSARLINLPVYQYIVNTLAAGVLKSPPMRDLVDESWKLVHSDIDLVGTDMDAFLRRALTLALVFGRVHAVSDMPRFNSQAPSLMHERQRGERPYAYLVTPLDVVDWSCDRLGRYNWITIRELSEDDHEPGEAPAELRWNYRVWTKDRWELYRECTEEERQDTGEKYILADSDEHGLGRVPVSTLYATRLAEAATMACETPLADFLDLNRDSINKLSELDELERSQTFSLFAIPEDEGGTGPISWGPFRAFVYSAQAGEPSFISPDASHPTGKWDRIEQRLFVARQLAGIGRGKAEYSKEERSAASISLESEDKKNQLAWWSKALSEFDHQLHRDLAAWEGKDEWPKAVYPANYETKGAMVAIQEAVQVCAVPVMADARKAQSAMLSVVLRNKLAEDGLDEIEIKGALDDLKKAGEKEPPEPMQKQFPPQPGKNPFNKNPQGPKKTPPEVK